MRYNTIPSFMKHRSVSSSDVEGTENNSNGNGLSRRRSMTGFTDSDLPLFVPTGVDCVPTTSPPKMSPFMRNSNIYRSKYSPTDRSLVPRCCRVITKYACMCTVIFLFCYSMFYYNEIIPYARETITTKTLVLPPWFKISRKSKALEASRLENDLLTLDLENLQAELKKAATLSSNLAQENEKFMHAIALLKEENEQLALTNEIIKPPNNQFMDEMNQAKSLRDEIQKISRHEVLQRYGPAPYHVEFHLKFPPGAPSAPDGSNPTTFVIELAPLDLMPHAVYTFLQMVDNGLWLEVSHDEDVQESKAAAAMFRQIARHIVVAQPRDDALKKFVNNNGIPTMSFSEYTKDYDHKKYTIGFIGAHPGPSFYISLENNMETHVGDPCFAKVISGFDAVDRLSTSPRNEHMLDPPVEIISVGWA